MPRSVKTKTRRFAPLRRLLESLVIPSLRGSAEEFDGDDAAVAIEVSRDRIKARAILRGGLLVFVHPASIDHERTMLRIDLLAGTFLGDTASQALIIGHFIEDTPFHVRTDFQLGSFGQMTIGCDLVVRADDEPLARRRLGELLELNARLDWFFPLRMPTRLRWQEIIETELPWEDLPHGELAEFLEHGMRVPRAERTPHTLLCIAQGLGEWKQVLRLLREHPDEFPPRTYAPLKAMANRELGRWMAALRAAREGRIRNGRYRNAPWLSPSYLHALVEAGEDIEALRLLGRHARGEPGFYDWLRGLALHRAGDSEGSRRAFDRYFRRWPGDVIGGYEAQQLAPDPQP